MSALHLTAAEERTSQIGSLVPETDMHFASLGMAFQADGRSFSSIEGGLEGGGSVSRSAAIK
jgi:hypothetical protein